MPNKLTRQCPTIYCFGVPCARLAPNMTYDAIQKCPWPSSAHSSRSTSLPTASCSRKGCPCFTISPAAQPSPASTSAPSRMCSGAIPHRFARGGRAVLGAGAADTRPDSGNGSRLYELHLWMWRYGRGQVRKVSVVQSMEARAKRLREARARAGETVKRRRREAASRAAA